MPLANRVTPANGEGIRLRHTEKKREFEHVTLTIYTTMHGMSVTGGRGFEAWNRGMTVSRLHGYPDGDERAQAVPWLDAVKVHTGNRGRRPRKHLKVIATG